MRASSARHDLRAIVATKEKAVAAKSGTSLTVDYVRLRLAHLNCSSGD